MIDALVSFFLRMSFNKPNVLSLEMIVHNEFWVLSMSTFLILSHGSNHLHNNSKSFTDTFMLPVFLIFKWFYASKKFQKSVGVVMFLWKAIFHELV
jgi:hypothetical protein